MGSSFKPLADRTEGLSTRSRSRVASAGTRDATLATDSESSNNSSPRSPALIVLAVSCAIAVACLLGFWIMIRLCKRSLKVSRNTWELLPTRSIEPYTDVEADGGNDENRGMSGKDANHDGMKLFDIEDADASEISLTSLTTPVPMALPSGDVGMARWDEALLVNLTEGSSESTDPNVTLVQSDLITLDSSSEGEEEEEEEDYASESEFELDFHDASAESIPPTPIPPQIILSFEGGRAAEDHSDPPLSDMDVFETPKASGIALPVILSPLHHSLELDEHKLPSPTDDPPLPSFSTLAVPALRRQRSLQMREAALSSAAIGPISKHAWVLRASEDTSLYVPPPSSTNHPSLPFSASRALLPPAPSSSPPSPSPSPRKTSSPLDLVPTPADTTTPSSLPLRRPRGYRSTLPEFDLALAMQLRPGLGIGADPAWMVRFLMAVFGWFTVMVTGRKVREERERLMRVTVS